MPRLFIIFLLFLSPGVLAQDDDDFFVFDEGEEAAAEEIADPLEELNRVTFAFNDKLYRVVLKPVARGLRVLPVPVRRSAGNFFSNLGAPVSAMSALLQADLKNTGSELGRFAINTTVGLLGLFDPATEMGLIEDEEDVGQAMGRWGLGHGFYLVIPFWGSSSLRDGIGTVFTAAINPIYEELAAGEILAVTFTATEVELSLDEDTYEALYDRALDPYIFFRSAWVQNRAGQVEK